MGFPTLIIDNFFDDPDKVVEYANTLEFLPSELGEWPGKRSEELWMTNPELFDYTSAKIYTKCRLNFSILNHTLLIIRGGYT